MTKIDNIKSLYEQIIDKDDFRKKVAEEFKVQPSTVRIGVLKSLKNTEFRKM